MNHIFRKRRTSPGDIYIHDIFPFLYTTALLRPGKAHQKVRKFAYKIVKIDQNRPKFGALYAKKYTSMKKYSTSGADGADLFSAIQTLKR